MLNETQYLSGFIKVGGVEGLEEKYMKAVPEIREPNSTCGSPREDAFHILRHPGSEDNPWPGLLLQASASCLWYWCADQVSLLFKTMFVNYGSDFESSATMSSPCSVSRALGPCIGHETQLQRREMWIRLTHETPSFLAF